MFDEFPGAAWYLKRLKTMSPGEVLGRLVGLAGTSGPYLRYKCGLGSAGPVAYAPERFAFCRDGTPQLPSLPWELQKLKSDAACAGPDGLDGIHSALGFAWRWEGDGDAWHRAPDSGCLWPSGFYSSIPYRPGNPIGDARVAFEPSRLQQLVAYALIFRSVEDEALKNAAADQARQQFFSWIAENPPLSGLHYISSMECALRVIASLHAWDLLREAPQARRDIWSALAFLTAQHAAFVARRLSRHSSAGNHTIAECVGLIYAGLTFPELRGAARWLRIGCDSLVQEAQRQVLADGGGIEQAFWYQRFIVELIGLACRVLHFYGEPVPPALGKAFERGRDFLTSVTGPDRALPPIGDGDGGYALSPYLNLLWDGEPQREGDLKTFLQAGYSQIIRSEEPDTSLLFDHGPLGMAPAYGHGHADALSLVLKLKGHPFLIDPGTYMYGGSPDLRRYFRGTAAHNTVEIDGEDQAQQETPFIWSSPYEAELLASEGEDGLWILLAQHDGYRKSGITHLRGIAGNWRDGWVVWDRLEGTGQHDLLLHWHCDATIRPDDMGLCLKRDKASLHLQLVGGDLEILRGTEGKAADAGPGWASPAYGVLKPITTLRLRHCGDLPYGFLTAIRVGGCPVDSVHVDRCRSLLESRMKRMGV